MRKMTVTLALLTIATACSGADGKDGTNGSANGGPNVAPNASNVATNAANVSANAQNAMAGTISTSDYDRSCNVNDDCRSVYEGDVCADCGCTNAAINVGAVQAYSADKDAMSVDCVPDERCSLIDCFPYVAFCNDGTCDSRPEEYVNARDYGQACEVPEDCTAIYEGEVCAVCACPNAAIAATDEAAYTADREATNCGITADILCAACAPIELDCVEGACVLLD